MQIGLFRDYKINRLVAAYNSGSYSIYADTTNLGSILPNEFVDVTAEGNLLRLKVGVIDKGLFSTILLIQNNLGSSITLDPKSSQTIKSRKYEENISLTATKNIITIVNLVDIDNYLSGVVESEGGGSQTIEYYKVQALISRTYALKYVGRHSKEGFSLCDGVHCQAYHSMLRFTPIIREAVHSTTGSVLLDENNQLIDAYFHANCGGQTCEPDYVWNNSVPYLTTFIDTFCIYTKQAKWEKRIAKPIWDNYFVSQFNYPIQDSIWKEKLYSFTQDIRKAFYLTPALGIPLRDIRTKFGLKSTFFSTHLEGEEVVIEGRGYGHGVGLCQEGAMKMSRLGYDYKQIAKFYFPGAKVIDLPESDFFKQLARKGPFKL
ncbi:MAG TPA: SpoIID/LytB domain-containing protein [Taishania sp.]|nr:SpoIID/LytB domain-containing protein [Taishania sp.]HNS42144.1 SpoIID/LytB domain-containing protein [Taishania sp.]